MATLEPANQVVPILAKYPFPFREGVVRSLESAGGFSGARLWRVTTAAGEFCLRRWPREHPTRERLAWIHATLRHLGQQGIAMVPVPVLASGGISFVEEAGFLWQIEPWLAGTADFHRQPTRTRLENCLTAVAHLHRAAATSPTGPALKQLSPGIQERRELVRKLLQGGSHLLNMALRRDRWPEGFDRGIELLALFSQKAPAVAGQLELASRIAVPIQPCLRDLWHDHVLFTGDQITGIIDFGALRGDNVATDLARLIGSLVGDDEAGWQAALDAYSAVRPLSADELALVTAFDQSNTLLSGIHWLQWIFLEKREFSDYAKILQRLDENLDRLKRLGIGTGGLRIE